MHRVLVVDDDGLVCISLARGLERHGYSVTTAVSGTQALSVFEHERFDVVVADIVMKAPDGLVLLERCKALHPETLVLMLTGYADFATAVRALRSGADDYLSKPCSADHLSNRIALCARRRRRVAATRSASQDLMVRETHHRIKNDLLTLSAFVGLQLPYVNDEFDRLLFEEQRTRIRTLALIHDQLVQGEDNESIDISLFLPELCRQTIRAFNPSGVGVSSRVDAVGASLSATSAITLGLIIGELLTNSMKYAFEPGGTGHIHVSFRNEGESYLLEFRDDGRGLPAGVSVGGASTLGMRVIEALTAQLRGTIRQEFDEGALFVLSFPQDLTYGGPILHPPEDRQPR